MNFLRLIHTVRNFKPDQVRQKMVYSLAKSKAARTFQHYSSYNSPEIFPFRISRPLQIPKSYANGRFTFLNSHLTLNGSPPWNEMKHGKLWNLRLNSFEYLLQEDINSTEGIELIRDFVKHASGNRTLYDAYSVSQRIMNWTTFFSSHAISDTTLLDFLYKQAQYLCSNPEYHLRNNHLLENGFALLRAGIFFQDERMQKTGARILLEELTQQVLRDGAHFELSPMYHCILLRRILESIDLLHQIRQPMHEKLEALLLEKAGVMCGWLKHIAFDNGDLPQFNDSGNEIAYLVFFISLCGTGGCQM